MSKTMNVPKLRFSEFSGDNTKYTFEDIFNFSTGKNIKQNEASPDFEIPCVRYGELYHMYGEVITKVINKTNLDKSELLFSVGNEILMPSAGEDPLDIGSASALTIKDVAIGRTINILRPLNENVYSQRYVSYYINTKLRKKISTLAKGSSISNVYNSDLKKLKILLPTIQEQKKIVSFLSSIDTKIEQLTKKESLLQEYKKGVMQKIFNQEIRFKADDGSEFCDWEEKKLGDISTKKSSNISANTLEENNGKYKIYGASGLLKYVDFYNEKNDYISIVKDGAGVGRVSLCDKESSVLGTLDIIKEKERINLKFVYLLLTRIHFEKYIVGSTIPHIYYKDYSLEKVKIPCLEEQTKIANFLSSIDKKIENTKTQLEKTKEFKKALLQQIFV